MRRVTFSRNVTLSLSRTCRCHCKYCAFATHKPHLHEPEEVERLIDRAARRGVKELLVLTGEAPAIAATPRRARLRGLRRLRRVGVREGRWSAGCCRTPTSACWTATDLARLREVTASQGLMLESTNPDLVAHQGSPTKHPAVRLETIRDRRRAEDPVHERDPGRHRRVRGGPDGVARGARRLRPHPGDHPPELRPAPAATTARSRRRSPPRRPSATGAPGLVRRAAPRRPEVGAAR